MKNNVKIIWYKFKNCLRESFEKSRQANYIFQVFTTVKRNARSFTHINSVKASQAILLPGILQSWSDDVKWV